MEVHPLRVRLDADATVAERGAIVDLPPVRSDRLVLNGVGPQFLEPAPYEEREVVRLPVGAKLLCETRSVLGLEAVEVLVQGLADTDAYSATSNGSHGLPMKPITLTV